MGVFAFMVKVDKEKQGGFQDGWKRKLSEVLINLGLMNGDFKGKIGIDVNQGGVRSLDKSEKFE